MPHKGHTNKRHSFYFTRTKSRELFSFQSVPNTPEKLPSATEGREGGLERKQVDRFPSFFNSRQRTFDPPQNENELQINR